MKRAVLGFLVFFLFAAMALAEDGDPKKAAVGVWTMGFCQAEWLPPSLPPAGTIPYGCTTQLVNFHEDGSVWSSYMFDQNHNSSYGGPSVGATGTWKYLGDHRFFVTMLRFINDHSNGRVKWLLRTDFTVEAYPKSDEAVTGKMAFMFYVAIVEAPLPFPVVQQDPYKDPPDEVWPGPAGIPMKRVPSFDPNSPVLQ